MLYWDILFRIVASSAHVHFCLRKSTKEAAMEDDDDVCPICLDPLKDTDILNMPVCGHKVHVRCALESAQYDSRCPMCRNDCITPRRDDFLHRFEADLQERLAVHRTYRTRRARAIRRHQSLKKLRDRLKDANRAYARADRDLDREWSKVLRVLWQSDEVINTLKTERTRCQRRLGRYKLQLRRRLEPLIGDEPDVIMI